MPGFDLVQQPGADADSLVEDRDAGRRAVRVAQDFEDRERPAQQRIRAARWLHHDELARAGERRDLGRGEREDVVVARTAACCAITAASMSTGIGEVYTWACGSCGCSRMPLLAGALGAAYLTVIVLQLNPHVPLAVGDHVCGGFAALGLFYGIHLAVVFYVLMVAREFFSLDILSPGWVSVRVLAWLSRSVAAWPPR